MGVITPDRFNPIKTYCNVRLQQGVPLVDADVNELDDIRKFEVRAFLKWFVGNGIPEGNDGFRIAAAAVPVVDDFQILAGSQLPPGPPPPAPSTTANDYVLQNCGRCIVEGLDVIIQTDTNYKAQTLSPVDLAPPYLLTPVAPIPNVAGPVLVYLDIWERVVAPNEDPSLIVPPLGTESCARIKRLWIVRTRVGTALPVSGDPDFTANHLYYGIASINRSMVGTTPQPIRSKDVTDLRERHLSMTPSILVSDVLGVTAGAYRQGQNRPATSLRFAINALSRGEVPSQAPQPVTNASTNTIEFPGPPVLDANGGLLVTYGTVAGNNTCQVFVTRLDTTDPAAHFSAPVQITSGTATHFAPQVLSLPGGDVLIVYQSNVFSTDGTADVFFRRASTIAGLVAAAEQPIANAPNVSEATPVAVLSGNIIVFFYLKGGNAWQYRRYQYVTSSFIDASPIAVPSATSELNATVDSSGNVWVATTTSAGVRVFRFNPATNAMDNNGTFETGQSGASEPFVITAADKVWAFWTIPAGISFARWAANTWSAAIALPYTAAGDRSPKAVVDPTGRLALAVGRKVLPDKLVGNYDIYLAYGDPITGGWVPPKVILSSDGENGPIGMVTGPGTFWLLSVNQTASAVAHMYYQQVFSPV